MRQRKSTTCSQCGTRGKFSLLEVMWRLGGFGPWTWCSGYPCASCTRGLLEFIGTIGVQVVATDG